MGYENCGSNPNSRANLLKGSNLPKLATTDPMSQELAELILNEEVEYNGAVVTRREALLREQVEKALQGDLRSCQFLIELAGRNERGATAIKTATLDPLEDLYAKMLPDSFDDRRKKADDSRRKTQR
jgi:hypothetical protein